MTTTIIALDDLTLRTEQPIEPGEFLVLAQLCQDHQRMNGDVIAVAPPKRALRKRACKRNHLKDVSNVAA